MASKTTIENEDNTDKVAPKPHYHHRHHHHHGAVAAGGSDDKIDTQPNIDNTMCKNKSERFSFERRSQSLDRQNRAENSANKGDQRGQTQASRNLKSMIEEKTDQIDKLIKRVTTLHSLNNQFAVEHERLQKQLIELQERCDQYELNIQEGCDSCRTYARNEEVCLSERESLAKENNQLREDIKMMKTLIYRLNVQLERYQELLRKHQDGHVSPNECLSEGQSGAGLNDAICMTPSNEHIHWGTVDSNALAPLLNAYQEMISDKTELIQQYQIELNQTTGRIKDILLENERLHSEVDNMKRSNESWITDKTRLQAQLDICRNKAEIHSKRADLAKEKLIEVLRCYEQKIQSQSLDVERLQEAYARTKGELTSYKNMQQQPEVVVESLKECQKLFEELKGQHEQEKIRMVNEISTLKANLSDLETSNQKYVSEIAELKSISRLQKEWNEVFDEKNNKLRQNLARVRQSRDSLKDRLKTTVTWNKNIQTTIPQTAAKIVAWQDFHKIEGMLRQKETQIQSMHAKHMEEIDRLNRKLAHRDETLKKVLLHKAKTLRK